MISHGKVATFAVVLVACVCVHQQRVSCQASDGDDQFEAFHGDIGRISATNREQVAPQTTIVQRQPVTAEPLVQPNVGRVFERPALAQPRSHHQHQHSSVSASNSARKPNRIILAPRRDPNFPFPVLTSSPPAQSSNRAAPLASHTQTAALLMPARLPEHPQPLQPTTLVEEQPSFDSAGSQFSPAQSAPQITHVSGGPALASFRSSANPHSQAASASDHASLISQVAAERALAAKPSDFSGQPQPEFNSPVPAAESQDDQLAAPRPSLGSPLESLSSPVLVQAQPSPRQAQQASASAQATSLFVDQPEEPQMAPSFENVMSRGCPQKGVFSYENKDHCDKYYLCTNGTFTDENCPNGLSYGTQGAVFQHCAYNWNVDCGRKKTSVPISSPGCPWQFGIFPIESNGRCSIDYFVCEWGVPETKRCSPEGLFYDDRIKGCQWADQLGCKSEAVLNFKCPAEDEANPYWPYPRYYHTTQDIIVCVNEQPRLVHCNEDQLVEPSSLACVDLKKNKKKKF